MLGLGLDQLVDVLASLESRAIQVFPRQCSRLRHRRSTCTQCADACPVHAITWGESLQVDADKCTGCGICATVCPTGALEARAPTNAELLAHIQEQMKTTPVIVFACPRYLEASNGDRNRFIPVNCLGRLDESILVGAVVLGAEALWLMDGACQVCPYAKHGPGGNKVAVQAVQRANALLKAMGVEPRIFMGAQLPDGLSAAASPCATGATLSRRAFFSLLARRTTGVAATAATATLDSILDSQDAQPEENQASRKGELPVRLPAKRRLLLTALRQIGKPVIAGSEVDPEPWAQFSFREECTGCQMCAFFCPTGALRKIQEEGKAGVAFRISHCTNCGLCQDICYKEAVVLSSSVDLSKVLGDAVDALWIWPEDKLKRLLGATSQKN